MAVANDAEFRREALAAHHRIAGGDQHRDEAAVHRRLDRAALVDVVEVDREGVGSFDGDLAPLGEDEDPIREREQFGELARGENHPHPLPAEPVDEGVELGLRPHVDAARGIVEKEDLGPCQQPAADDAADAKRNQLQR